METKAGKRLSLKECNFRECNFYEYYYIAVMLFYFISMFSGYSHPGVMATILMIAVAAETVFLKRVTLGTTTDFFVLAYFAYNVLSAVWLVNGSHMPLQVFFDEFAVSVLPMVFYLVGKAVNEENKEAFYRKCLWALLFCFVTGIILFVWAPQFYIDWLFKMSYISKADAPTMRVRMLSFISSIPEGNLTVVGMLISSYFLIRYRGKRGKAAYLICLLSAFMSNQRSAMVVAALSFLYLNYLLFYRFKLLSKKYLVYECAAVAVVVAGVAVFYTEAILKVWYRVRSLPLAIGERSESWIAAVNNMTNVFLGNGLGANGHRAIGYTEHLVADGGWVKLYCEMGVIGTTLFLYIMLRVLKNGYENMLSCYVELGILAVALLQCVGNNIITYQIAAPLFWFAAGRCGRRAGDAGRLHKEAAG